LIGEWLALPLLREAGSKRPGDAIYDEILYPIANRLLGRCDAVLRLRGTSKGADEDVRLEKNRGLRVFDGLADVPNTRVCLTVKNLSSDVISYPQDRVYVAEEHRHLRKWKTVSH
jgi:hypothetical protein